MNKTPGAARSISWQLSPCMQIPGSAACRAVSLCKGGERQRSRALLPRKNGSLLPGEPVLGAGQGTGSSYGEADVPIATHGIN